MKYRIESNYINEAKLKKLSNGKNGGVYKYSGDAVKIFSTTPPIDEETARTLSNIRTRKILLPKKLVYNKDKFTGYTMKLVSRKPTTKSIINIDKENLVNNIKDLEEDINLLSTKNILLNGMSIDNTIFNGSLYITDPSNYKIFETSNIYDLQKLNNYQLSLLLNSIILKELNKVTNKETLRQIKKLLELKDNNTYYSEYLDAVVEDKENIKTLVKRL